MSWTKKLTSLKSFEAWLKSRQKHEAGHTLYGRIAEGRNLIVSDVSEMPGLYPDSPMVPLAPLTLPAPEDARSWWRNLRDGEIAGFYLCNRDGDVIVCAAKAALWSALPDLHLALPKRVFKGVDERGFRTTVGKEADAMIRELERFWLSVRRVVDPTETEVSNRVLPARNRQPRE